MRPGPTPQQTRNRAGSLRDTAFWLDNEENLLDTVEWQPDFCATDSFGTFDPCAVVEKSIAAGTGPETTNVVGIYAGVTCTTLSGMDVIEAMPERASNALRNIESDLVEEILWTESLTNGDANDLTSGTPVGIVPALRLILENLRATIPGIRAVIHVPQLLVTDLFFYGQAVRVGNQLQLSGTDHLIVAGSGYPGTDPDGQAADAGTTWIYATGPVQVLASAPFIPDPRINRATNELVVFAEESVAAYFDSCTQLAANVCLPDPGPGCES